MNIMLSHLLFTDDLLLFGEATKENASCMLNMPVEFVKILGLKVNRGNQALCFLEMLVKKGKEQSIN